MQIVNTILGQMSNISKSQANFLVTLLTTLMPNYRNLSRYSGLCEKTYSRQFRKPFDLVEFNPSTVCYSIPNPHTQIAAMDSSFCDKSGKRTWGLDKFYNASLGKVQNGREISTLAIIDVDDNTACNLSIRQTSVIDDPQTTRIDWYLDHLKQDRHAIDSSVRYLEHDGHYQKKKFIDIDLLILQGTVSNRVSFQRCQTVYRFDPLSSAMQTKSCFSFQCIDDSS